MSNDIPGISAEVPDWTRESKLFWQWDPGKSLLASIRSYQRNERRRSPIGSFMRKQAVLRHRIWSVICGAEIPINCQIGGGLNMPHPNGIIINSKATIGPNCLIFQQVTIGANHRGIPRIGGQVDIGAGAKILGPIIVGDHAVIGANSVVVKDVLPSTTVVGVPARAVSPDVDDGEP
jgi:serine O-acetyltransferase